MRPPIFESFLDRLRGLFSSRSMLPDVVLDPWPLNFTREEKYIYEVGIETNTSVLTITMLYRLRYPITTITFRYNIGIAIVSPIILYGQYVILYRAVFQRKGERKSYDRREKCLKNHNPTYCKHGMPSTTSQISRTFRHSIIPSIMTIARPGHPIPKSGFSLRGEKNGWLVAWLFWV